MDFAMNVSFSSAWQRCGNTHSCMRRSKVCPRNSVEPSSLGVVARGARCERSARIAPNRPLKTGAWDGVPARGNGLASG
eukprot:6211028-Pleurochrysis_carterae.AAC.3